MEMFPWKENAMDRLIGTANIQYFRERLAAAREEREIKDLRFLIAREECRLRDASPIEKADHNLPLSYRRGEGTRARLKRSALFSASIRNFA